MTSYRINNLLDPSSSADAATKSYVDSKTTDMATTAYVTGTSWTNNPTVTDNNESQYYRVVFTNGTTGRASLLTDGNLFYNPNANILYAGTFSGAISGTTGTFSGAISGTTGTFSGNIGIGTTTPTYPLHVNGTGVAAGTTGGYIDSGNAGRHTATDSRLVVAGFVGGWVAGNTGFIIFSDQRIKSDIINIDTTTNLELFRKIRPVKHGYIDKLEYGNLIKYGFIAQEIQQLLPEAVVEGTQIIPSVYCNANIVNTQNNFLLRFEKPLKDIQQFKIGIKLKCYDTKNEILWVTIKEIIDAQNIEIEENITNDKLFVYGHSVDDFLQIEKDTIWTVATAALQEVDRQQQADKVRIAELEAKVAEQQSLINDILERLKTLEKA